MDSDFRTQRKGEQSFFERGIPRSDLTISQLAEFLRRGSDRAQRNGWLSPVVCNGSPQKCNNRSAHERCPSPDIETLGMNGLLLREKTETACCRNALQENSNGTCVSARLYKPRTLTWATENSL